MANRKEFVISAVISMFGSFVIERLLPSPGPQVSEQIDNRINVKDNENIVIKENIVANPTVIVAGGIVILLIVLSSTLCTCFFYFKCKRQNVPQRRSREVEVELGERL